MSAKKTDEDLRRIDMAQRLRSGAMLMLGVLCLGQTSFIWRSAGEAIAGEGDAVSYMFLGCAFTLALIITCLIGSQFDRKGASLIDDEFSRSLSLRALLTGLCALGVGTIGLFGFGVAYPLKAVQAIPLLLLDSAVLAGVTFAILDLRADKGE